MLLNFKKQFRPYILDGSKAHTIRGERGDGKRPKPGEMLHLYTGLRQKGAEFILRAPCVKTEDVEIYKRGLHERIRICGYELNFDEADALAWADGFRYVAPLYKHEPDRKEDCFDGLMVQFWEGRLPFRGWITYWDYSKAEFVR